MSQFTGEIKQVEGNYVLFYARHSDRKPRHVVIGAVREITIAQAWKRVEDLAIENQL